MSKGIRCKKCKKLIDIKKEHFYFRDDGGYIENDFIHQKCYNKLLKKQKDKYSDIYDDLIEGCYNYIQENE